ncbi:MAG: glycosyltransferase family 39 protein [Pseudobutyrivibrio sp.]|nr:glycosyltransferase family 39 protein [Pseudobutyrivibrio sp.]
MIKESIKNISKYKILAIFIIGFILRLVFVGRVPGNYNFMQDEAFSAYKAYSMVNYGIDSHGYHNPVYLETWGSGMSAVQCYIQTLFIRILGFTPIAIRLPQAILGCITLVFFYLLIKEIATREIAFWATVVLAVCPWHITMSRWGLDCNYYIGFITLAMYMIISSRNVLWKTIVAAVVTAIALYSYASPWVVMPILVYGTIIYLFIRKEINIKSIIIFTVILGILVMPLFLFILVNMGFMDEIRGSIISIPKLSYFRSDDVKPSLANIKTMLHYFWVQYDLISYDSTPMYGTYYLFSNVFLVIGLIKDIVKRNRRAIIMWIWLLCGFIMGASIEANFEGLNILFLPLIYFIGIGIVFVINLFRSKKIIGSCLIGVLYTVATVIFTRYYFTDYNEMIERVWPDGAQEVIEYAGRFDGTKHIADIRHPIVLCYSKYPVDKYVATVEYADEHAKFLSPLHWEGYDFLDYTTDAPVSGDVYICSVENENAVYWLSTNKMKLYAQFGTYYIAVAE